MAIIQGWVGHATSANTDKAKQEFGGMLVSGEEVLCAYKWVRDPIVFTTHRIIYVDVQGITGKKKSYMQGGWIWMPSFVFGFEGSQNR